MRPVYQATGLVLIVGGLLVAKEASSLTLYTELGPSSGFFPFWISLILVAVSAGWLAQVTLRPVEGMPADLVPDRVGLARVLAILVALVLFTWQVHTLGYQVTMFLFLFFLLMALGRQSVLVTLVVCLAGSAGIYYIFNTYLDVRLPESSIEFLSDLGL